MRRSVAGIVVWLLGFLMLTGLCEEAYCPIEEGLCLERMLRENGSVSVNRIYYDADGNEYFSTFQHADLDETGGMRIVYEDSDGNVEILSEHMSMGFDAWSVEMYRMVFLMDEYEENIDMMKESFFCDVLLNEKIVSDETKDGKRTVVTDTVSNASEELDTRRIEYIFDAETQLLECVADCFVHPDGIVEIVSRAEIVYGQAYESAMAFEKVTEPESTRVIKVFFEADGQITATVITAPSDVNVMFVYPEEYVLYEDAERTRMYAGQQKDENGLYPEYTEIYIGSF